MRKEATARRKLLVSQKTDEQIARRLFSSELMRYQSFFVYLSFRTEVGTKNIIDGLLFRGKDVFVPLVTGDRMISTDLKNSFVKGKFGILQPSEGEEKTAQVALVPLLCVDEQGNRLGYGGGYYDRYFTLHSDVLRIGVAYSGQLVAHVPTEETDIPLDGILSENGVAWTRRRDLI